MRSVLLDTPHGISARLGWDPKVAEHDRKRMLARELVAARLGVDAEEVRVEREAPAQFGFHTELFATASGQDVPLAIRNASFRAATVVAVAEPGTPVGLDIRDLRPDEATLRDMRRHSHLVDESDVGGLLAHWTRVQAVREADGRGARVRPEQVRLDAGRATGWVPDRHLFYRLADLSRDGFVITLAYVPAAE